MWTGCKASEFLVHLNTDGSYLLDILHCYQFQIGLPLDKHRCIPGEACCHLFVVSANKDDYNNYQHMDYNLRREEKRTTKRNVGIVGI